MKMFVGTLTERITAGAPVTLKVVLPAPERVKAVGEEEIPLADTVRLPLA